MPHEIISALFKRFFPKLERQLTRTVTIPRTQTITSHNGPVSPGTKVVSYISFDAVVGRNSAFHQLTHDQLEEIGGVEYRGLTALLWIVGAVRIRRPLSLCRFQTHVPSTVPYRFSTNFLYRYCSLHIYAKMAQRIHTPRPP